jgi:hypothetical protein
VAIGALVPAAKLDVSPVNGIAAVGGELRLTSVARDSNGAVLVGREPEWTSSDTSLATVLDGVVTGKKVGTVVITARSERATASVLVAITPMRVARVIPSTSSVTLIAGGTAIVSVRPVNAAGVPVPGRVASWSVRDARVATAPSKTDPATSELVVRGVAAGSTKLDVEIDGVRTSIDIFVKARPASQLQIVQRYVSLLVNESYSLDVDVRDVTGVVQNGRDVVWKSLSPGVASVDSAGVVRGRATGSTSIVAIVDGISDAMTVQVRSLERLSITQLSRVTDSDGEIATYAVTALDESGVVIDQLSAAWTIQGGACLLNKVGPTTRVVLHANESSILTATVGSVKATLVIQGTGTVETAVSH